MAVACTNLTSGIDTTAGTSATTASITPGANHLILCTVSSYRNDSTDPIAPTISGNGLTWVQINTSLFDSTSTSRRRVTLFRAMGSSPSGGTVTISFGSDTQFEIAWVIDDCSGTDTTGTNGSGAIVQNNVGTGSSGSITITLSAFSSTNNATYGSFGCAGDTLVAGSGFTVTGNGGGFANNIAAAAEFRSDNSTTVNGTWTNDPNQISGGIAIEIKAASTFTFQQLVQPNNPLPEEISVIGY